MRIFVAGIGPGKEELISLSAIERARSSDIILVPRSEENTTGISERVISHFTRDKAIFPVYFPMIRDELNCIGIIRDQLMRQDWSGISSVFFPVIGDAMLYSTGEYLIRAFKELIADIEVEFIPGISAHSLAASIEKKFLAMRDEIFTVISGTATPKRILSAMRSSDVVAIYKPKAIKNLRELIADVGELKRVIRVDYAGIPEKEVIHEGLEALEGIDEYMSIVLVWLGEKKVSREQEEYQRRILEMAHQDYLTGLATRWYLQEYMQANENEPITCIYFDLDNFKSVNDTYGHQAGDRALAATAEMMQREFTEGFCARMGGDEFMIVLTGDRELRDVECKVNEFMSGLLSYYATTRTMKGLSVSAGISQRKDDKDKNMDRLIHESDIALYEAKKGGKGCCRVYNASMEM